MTEGLLVLAYGTPRRLEDVGAYYTHIRRGDPPPAALLDELVGRYAAVGGPTALNRITDETARALGDALAARGRPVRVEVGFKHVAPFVGDAVAALAAAGVRRAVALVLAPHFSSRSIAEYEAYAEAARPPSLALDVVRSWHDDPGYVAALARRLAGTLAASPPDPLVVFTAHSIPARAVESGDPYPDELLRTCALVAAAAGDPRWTFAWQSAGRTAEPWLGPDVLAALEDLARAGERAVVLHPVGFVSDHLEVLYDLDVEARAAAERLGLAWARVPMPNADPDFVAALAGLVLGRMGGGATLEGV